MVARLALWSLADSATSVDELRDALREEAQAPGLLFGAWVSDETTERFGVFQLWVSAEEAEAPLPLRVRELIGADPQIAEVFDVESTSSALEQLRGLGLAHE